jgi:protein-disulfide isomerase
VSLHLDRAQRFGVVAGTAGCVALLLVVASLVGARQSTATRSSVPPRHASTLFAGIRQQGAALGSAGAPVTLVEYADLQCPYCAEWARDALPTVVARYVRTGQLRLVFNGLAFIGPDSEQALRSVVAAGRQGHLWDLVHGLYLRQGPENSGWVGDAVGEVAAGVPGIDVAQLGTARDSAGVEADIRRSFAAAQAAGIRSTPSFMMGPTGGALAPVHVASLAASGITPAIEEALAR